MDKQKFPLNLEMHNMTVFEPKNDKMLLYKEYVRVVTRRLTLTL